jgi:hypothetical protein
MSLRYLISPVLVLAFLALVSPLSIQADPEIIPAGNDYLITLPGTYTTLPNGVVVPLMGNPSACGSPCLGGSDTVVHRDTEVLVTPDVQAGQEGTISTTLTQLWLKSTAPVNIGGSFFDVFVNLDPAAPPSTGLLDLQNTSGDGTPSVPEGVFKIDSFFDIFVELSITPAGGGPPAQVVHEKIQLGAGGSGWNDPDDGAASFLALPVQECTANLSTCHVAVNTSVPEPGSVLLLMTAMAGCAFALRKKYGRISRLLSMGD